MATGTRDNRGARKIAQENIRAAVLSRPPTPWEWETLQAYNAFQHYPDARGYERKCELITLRARAISRIRALYDVPDADWDLLLCGVRVTE